MSADGMVRPCFCPDSDGLAMGFNKQKMEHARRDEAEKQARTRRALDTQILEDALRFVAAWNEQQEG